MGQIACVGRQEAAVVDASNRGTPRPVTVIGASVPPYHTLPGSVVGVERLVGSAAVRTRSIVVARSAEIAPAAR